MKIIGLTGRARAGKGTVAGVIKQYCETKNLVCVTYAFADPIYAMIQALLQADDVDFPYGKNENNPAVLLGTSPRYADKSKDIPWLGVSIRTLAETLGDEWGQRLINRDIWRIKAAQWLDRVKYADDADVAVFTDVRYYDEAVFVQKEGGCLIRVSRPDTPAQKPTQCVGGDPDHASRKGIAPARCDAFVVNCSTLDALRADAEYTFHLLTGI